MADLSIPFSDLLQHDTNLDPTAATSVSATSNNNTIITNEIGEDVTSSVIQR